MSQDPAAHRMGSGWANGLQTSANDIGGEAARAAQKENGVSGNGMGTTRFVEYKIRYAGILLQNARQHIHSIDL